ncbi:TPA: transposase [Enterobacter asburiae]|nr:transposase [Enterobacter asburiae]
MRTEFVYGRGVSPSLSIGGEYEHTTIYTEFKEEAVSQITERGYSVAEACDRLGVSARRLYKWLRAGLSNLIAASRMPGVYWKPKARS